MLDRFEAPRTPVRSVPRAASSDPFFDRPYEPTVQADARPAWDQKTAAAQPAAGRSPNIRAKRKVASLLGGSK